MKFSQRQIIIVVAVIAVVGIVGYLVATNLRSSTRPPEVKLRVWGEGEARALLGPLFQQYEPFRPNVKISYENIDEDGYDEKVVDALASGQGPDVLMLSNRALPKQIARLAPAVALQISIAEVQNLFPRVVEQDFVARPPAPEGSADVGQAPSVVYALPLSIDTLALFYNKDIFDTAGIVSPPKTWSEFQALVPALRTINESRQLVRAAAAIGGSEKTVPHAVDILNLLMLQSGTEMTNANFTAALFSDEKGIAAMNYYLQFGDAVSSVYTWNENQPPAFDSFLSGKTAMVFGYMKDAEALKQKSPFFPLGIAPVPQGGDPSTGSGQVSYANYDGLAVSKQSKVPEWAWDFVLYATTDENIASLYTNATRRPPALRTLIDKAKTSAELGVFAKQALTARSWHNPDMNKVEALFNSAILQVIRGQSDVRQALRQVKDQVDQLFRANSRQ